MNEHGEELTQQLRIDPAVVVGVFLLMMFLLTFGVNMARSFFDGETVQNEVVAISAETSTTITPTQPAALLLALPTAVPTASPTLLPTETTILQPTRRPISAQSDAATATPFPPTLTPTPTATQLPPTATNEPIDREPQPREQSLLTDDGINVLASPTPTPLPPDPTPYPSGDYTERVPILMYHYVSSPPADADKYRVDLSVQPSELLKQMQYLRDNGYTSITLNDLARALANQQTLPPKPIILTFDDGHLDNYLNAFPVLQATGMIGTFFIITDLPDIEHPDYMSWPMIEEMAAAGMQIEIHTKSHRSLADRDEAFLETEIAGSQEIIAFHTGSLPRFLAYPGGSYDDATIAAARDLDLWGALTTQHGYTHGYRDRYEMKRVRIRNTTTIEFFAEWIEGK